MKKYIFYFLLILLVLSCKKDDEQISPDPEKEPEEAIGLEAIITSESTIYTYGTLVLDASGSTGDIVGYKWELISYSYDTIQVDSTNYDKPIESYTPWIDERVKSNQHYHDEIDSILKSDYKQIYKPLIGEQFEPPLSTRTDSIIKQRLIYPGNYEFKLTLFDVENDSSSFS
jgi:hypothetical protein